VTFATALGIGSLAPTIVFVLWGLLVPYHGPGAHRFPP
jgi:hypothetical protein